MRRLSRRDLLRSGTAAAAVTGISGIVASLFPAGDGRAGARFALREGEHRVPPTSSHSALGHDGSTAMTVGDVDTETMGFDPSAFLTTFDYGEVGTLPDGRTVRDYQIVAYDKEI